MQVALNKPFSFKVDIDDNTFFGSFQIFSVLQNNISPLNLDNLEYGGPFATYHYKSTADQY